MNQVCESRKGRTRKIRLPPSGPARGCLGFISAVVLVLSIMFIVQPIYARLVGDAAVKFEPGSAKMAAFFWLIAAIATLPAIGITVFNAWKGWHDAVHEVADHPSGGPVASGREAWVLGVLAFLSFGWPMFTMGTQYKSVSTVRLSERIGLSLRGSEFLQDTALTAFSVSFTSFFSMYILHFAYKKLRRRAALLVSALYLTAQLVVFVLVGRNIGDKYW